MESLACLIFQSTLPSQGATKSTSSYTAKILISIHAPLTGSDSVAAFSSFAICNFNPRSPHRERLCSSQRALAVIYFNPRSPHRERRSKALTFLGYDGFQSTLPSQGATASGMTRGQSTGISIHAPLTGSDKRIYDAYKLYRNFNPRSPHRERLCVRLALIDLQSISIHAPLTGSDVSHMHNSILKRLISIHAPLTGSDNGGDENVDLYDISIHAPLTGSDATV